MLPSRHGHRVVDDVGGRQPWLNIGVTSSGAKLREAFTAVERDHWRIFVACHSRNLGQLVGKVTVNSTAVELVILESERHMIHQPGVESVVPIYSYHRGAFERCTAIADGCG